MSKLFCHQINFLQFQASDCSCSTSVDLDLHENCERTGLGNIMALCGSLMNHSCNANTDRIFRDGKIIICANRPIEKDEQVCKRSSKKIFIHIFFSQLFCSYGPNIGMKKSKRQVILYNNYYFTCDCPPCREDWPTEDYEEVKIDLFFNLAEKIFNPKMLLF